MFLAAVADALEDPEQCLPKSPEISIRTSVSTPKLGGGQGYSKIAGMSGNLVGDDL